MPQVRRVAICLRCRRRRPVVRGLCVKQCYRAVKRQIDSCASVEQKRLTEQRLVDDGFLLPLRDKVKPAVRKRSSDARSQPQGK